MSGTLQVVATPLGNLEDLSTRARRALENADAIAAEDTRRAGRLLQLLGLPPKPLLSYFAPREAKKAGAVLDRLRQGQTIVLISDGGTPGISDPGALLVGRARAEGVRVEPIPGPSAVTAALSVSPLSGQRFVFEGFLPSKAQARKNRIEALSDEERTIVFYEAPHRLAAMLRDLTEAFGEDRHITIVREVTKLHEEILDGSLGELSSRLPGPVRGEIVVVVEGGEPDPERIVMRAGDILALLTEAGLSPDRAARTLASATGLPRSRLLRLARSASGD